MQMAGFSCDFFFNPYSCSCYNEFEIQICVQIEVEIRMPISDSDQISVRTSFHADCNFCMGILEVCFTSTSGWSWTRLARRTKCADGWL